MWYGVPVEIISLGFLYHHKKAQRGTQDDSQRDTRPEAHTNWDLVERQRRDLDLVSRRRSA